MRSASTPAFTDLTTDEQALLASWLQGRPLHTQHSYRGNVARFIAHVGKPLAAVTLSDLQDYADTLTARVWRR